MGVRSDSQSSTDLRAKSRKFLDVTLHNVRRLVVWFFKTRNRYIREDLIPMAECSTSGSICLTNKTTLLVRKLASFKGYGSL